jgi:hypothetical protein
VGTYSLYGPFSGNSLFRISMYFSIFRLEREQQRETDVEENHRSNWLGTRGGILANWDYILESDFCSYLKFLCCTNTLIISNVRLCLYEDPKFLGPKASASNSR